MREVLDHRVEGKGGGADDTRIFAVDEPGQGGACHHYVVLSKAKEQEQDYGGGESGKVAFIDEVWYDVLLRVEFQNGPIQEVGLNGAQQEHLAVIILDRLRSFQAGPFASQYNENAISCFFDGLRWLKQRTVDRIARQVEGFNKQ